jgi:hypothetical protein
MYEVIPMNIKFIPKNIAGILGITMVGLLILHLLACLPMFFRGRAYPIGLFSFDGEMNLPTIFSAVLLWFSAFLAGSIAWDGRNGILNRFFWAGLALAFLAAGLDEAFMFHERFTVAIREQIGASGLLYFAWVVPYAILVLLFIAVYGRFFFTLPTDTRRHIALAAVLYVGGAIGVEMLGGAWVEFHGKDIVYYLLATTEEVLEMSGSIIFIYAFLYHIARHLPDLYFKIFRV